MTSSNVSNALAKINFNSRLRNYKTIEVLLVICAMAHRVIATDLRRISHANYFEL